MPTNPKQHTDHVTHSCFLQSHNLYYNTQSNENKCTLYTVLQGGNDFAKGFTVAAVWHIWYSHINEVAWAVKEACTSPASYSGSVVYVGEQGGVWREESLGGVCYQGTGPNSWLILELLERKSKRSDFPSCFFFFCSSGKLFWKYMFAEKCNMFSNLYLQECNRRLFFTGLTYWMFYTQKIKPSQQYSWTVWSPPSQAFIVLMLYNNDIKGVPGLKHDCNGLFLGAFQSWSVSSCT